MNTANVIRFPSIDADLYNSPDRWATYNQIDPRSPHHVGYAAILPSLADSTPPYKWLGYGPNQSTNKALKKFSLPQTGILA